MGGAVSRRLGTWTGCLWGSGDMDGPACGALGTWMGQPVGFWGMDGLPVGFWDVWRSSHADIAVPLGWSSHSGGL